MIDPRVEFVEHPLGRVLAGEKAQGLRDQIAEIERGAGALRGLVALENRFAQAKYRGAGLDQLYAGNLCVQSHKGILRRARVVQRFGAFLERLVISDALGSPLLVGNASFSAVHLASSPAAFKPPRTVSPTWSFAEPPLSRAIASASVCGRAPWRHGRAGPFRVPPRRRKAGEVLPDRGSGSSSGVKMNRSHVPLAQHGVQHAREFVLAGIGDARSNASRSAPSVAEANALAEASLSASRASSSVNTVKPAGTFASKL